MITIDTDHPITNMAAEKWGILFQLDILQEEAGEVVTAISRFERGRVGKEKVAEEIADFIVSMMSVVPVLDIEEDVIRFRDSKLKRLSLLMEKGDKRAGPLRKDDSIREAPSWLFSRAPVR